LTTPLGPRVESTATLGPRVEPTARALPALPAAPLRVVFMGTPDLAATVLAALLDGPDHVVGVFSRPDATRGRGLALEAPPVKQLAGRHGIPVFQPRFWKDGSALEMLRGLQPDLVVVAAYGRLLPQAALDVPAFGCINVHASLLPRWRGADPITRAILAGDAESGVTIMQMVLEMDAGDMLLKRAIPISPDDTGESLEHKLATLGAATLGEALVAWRAGRLAATAQDPAAVTLAPMIRKADGVIDWHRSSAEIERAVRGYVPWPVAATTRAGAPVRVWRAALAGDAPPDVAPGTVLAVDARGIVVATGHGALALAELQAAGKKRMPARDWAHGARVVAGEVLGA
jgi:methionyl-tRNA formyltransferase